MMQRRRVTCAVVGDQGLARTDRTPDALPEKRYAATEPEAMAHAGTPYVRNLPETAHRDWVGQSPKNTIGFL